jgi:hypothetical protein
MPQDIDEFMKRRTTSAPQPAAAPASSIDEFMQKRRTQPTPTAQPTGAVDDFMRKRSGLPPGADLLGQAERESKAAAGMVGDLPPGPGTGENIAIGAQRGLYNRILPAVSALTEVTEGMKVGDFGPALQMAKEAGRGVLHALKPPSPQVTRDASGTVTGMELRPPDPAIVAAQQQRRQRYQASPDYKRAQAVNERLDARARLDPSIAGKITRGASEAITTAAPAIAAGAAGGVPAVAAVSALQSADDPSQMGPNAALAALPTPGVGALARRLRGKPGLTAEPVARASLRTPQQQPLFDAAARSPWQDTVLGYYRANLLTNPTGRALDLASTGINQVADAAARPVAAAVDVIVSKLTGQRSITGPSLRGTGKALGSIRQGLRDAGEMLRTGQQAIDSGADAALYGNEIKSGLGKAFDVPVNGVFRVMGAMDAPFRRFGFTRNLEDRARVAAINEAKRGIIPRNQIDARAAQLVDRHDIIAGAVRDGERAVLSEPNKISSWLASQTRNNPNARLAIGVVQPFMRIPLNSVLRAADFSGVGGLKALYKIARGGARKIGGQSFFRDIEEQRVFAQNVASGSFAPAAFLLGMELEEQGKLEGYYYTSKKDFPNGRVPTSINIGNENYDINRLGGYVAAPLFIGATYSRLRRQGSDQANALLRSFSGLAQQAPALGYYGAPAKAGRILTADEPGSELVREAGSMTSGFIPASGAMGAAAKAIDQNRRREDEGFTGPIMNRIPGLRGQLPEKQQRSRIQSGAAYAAKLREYGIEGGSVQRFKGEPEELFNARRQRVGQWSDKYGEGLVSHPEFSRLTPSQQKHALKNLQENIREESNDKFPNMSLFEPYRLIDQARRSEGEKTERNRRKYYVEP